MISPKEPEGGEVGIGAGTHGELKSPGHPEHQYGGLVGVGTCY